MKKHTEIILLILILTLGVILLVHKPSSIKIKNNLLKSEINVEILF